MMMDNTVRVRKRRWWRLIENYRPETVCIVKQKRKRKKKRASSSVHSGTDGQRGGPSVIDAGYIKAHKSRPAKKADGRGKQNGRDI